MGGWEPAARLSFGDALAIAERSLKKDLQDVLRHAQVCYHSALPLYAMGGDPPPPPELDDDDEDDD